MNAQKEKDVLTEEKRELTGELIGEINQVKGEKNREKLFFILDFLKWFDVSARAPKTTA